MTSHATRVLVLNSGSSSVKYQLLDMRDGTRLAAGLVERIGESASRLVHTPSDGQARERTERITDHDEALRAVADELALDGAGIDSPSWRRSATAWCTAGFSSAPRR